MATPREKRARSLEALYRLQGRGGGAIRSAALSRADRERLLAGRFLEEVMKGGYIPFGGEAAALTRHAPRPMTPLRPDTMGPWCCY